MKKLAIFCMLAILIGSATVSAQSDISSLEQTINKGTAKNIKALIHVSGGSLHVNGGAEELADVNFSFDKYEWDPSVSYEEQDNVGKLKVSAKIHGDEKRIDDDNKCKIRLNKDLNYSLGVVLGAGEADVNLENFNIKKALFRLGVGSFDVNFANTSLPLLKVEAGIGEATFNLSGEWFM